MKVIIFLAFCLMFSCLAMNKMAKNEILIPRKYVGEFVEYRYTNPGLICPGTCWIKTTLSPTMGEIPVAGTRVKYKPGETLYLKRTYGFVPGRSWPGMGRGFWYYCIESDSSKHIYPIRER